MSSAFVLHGQSGDGKTRACLMLVEAARSLGINAAGVVTPRAAENIDLAGYDIMDVASGDHFPIARLRETVTGSDWFVFGKLIYAFSTSGFRRANEILLASAESMHHRTLVFVDEFGRLERNGLGLYMGAVSVAERLRDGGAAVFTCRTDLIDIVEGLLQGKARSVSRYPARDAEVLRAEVTRVFDHCSKR